MVGNCWWWLALLVVLVRVEVCLHALSHGLWQMVAVPSFEASVMRRGMTLLFGEAGRRKVAVGVEGIDSFLPDGRSDVDIHPS
ncbi:hypothetical protein SLA2020_484570 [Shorea laevis]